MKKAILLVLFTSFLFLSCSDDDDILLPACGVNNAIQNLEWLKAEIDRRNANPTEDMKYCYIVQAKLDGEDVFIYEDCNPLIDKAIPFFNCEGTIINTQDNPIGLDNLRDKMIIWKRTDFVCQVSF